MQQLNCSTKSNRFLRPRQATTSSPTIFLITFGPRSCCRVTITHLLLVVFLFHAISPTNAAFAAIRSRSSRSRHLGMMTWSDTWDDILAGGSPRWKVEGAQAKQAALSHIVRHHHASSSNDNNDNSNKLQIFCPLAGDDSFVHHAWSQGHDVTALDLVPAAVAAMRAQFGEEREWSGSSSSSSKNEDEEDGTVMVWRHTPSGRATLYQGDALKPIEELAKARPFDAIYDKDSFGALNAELRNPFCQRLAEYIKPGGILYVEVKNKPEGPGRAQGPPFHLEKEDLMNHFGPYFDYVEALGEVYKAEGYPPGIKQMGHVLKRIVK